MSDIKNMLVLPSSVWIHWTRHGIERTSYTLAAAGEYGGRAPDTRTTHYVHAERLREAEAERDALRAEVARLRGAADKRTFYDGQEPICICEGIAPLLGVDPLDAP